VVLKDEEWINLFESTPVPNYVTAHTFVRKWQSASQPVALRCSDNQTWVCKGLLIANPNSGRSVFSDYVLGRSGIAIGAPVPSITLVDISNTLIAAQPEMNHLTPGLAHGSLLMNDCSDRLDIFAPASDQQRRDIASIAIFYGWAHCNDLQIIKQLSAPEDIFTVDHGHFLHGGPNWTVATLAAAPPPVPHPSCTAHLTAANLDPPLNRLRAVGDTTIAGYIAAAPGGWGITADEKLALAKYLSQRRDELVKLIGAP
jgi:hypothetical protein